MEFAVKDSYRQATVWGKRGELWGVSMYGCYFCCASDPGHVSVSSWRSTVLQTGTYNGHVTVSPTDCGVSDTCIAIHIPVAIATGIRSTAVLIAHRRCPSLRAVQAQPTCQRHQRAGCVMPRPHSRRASVGSGAAKPPRRSLTFRQCARRWQACEKIESHAFSGQRP